MPDDTSAQLGVAIDSDLPTKGTPFRARPETLAFVCYTSCEAAPRRAAVPGAPQPCL